MINKFFDNYYVSEKEGITIAYPVQSLDFGVKGGVNIFDKPLEIKK